MITKWFHNWITTKANEIHMNEAQINVKRGTGIKERAMYGVAINQASDTISTDRSLDAYPDLSFKMYHAENGVIMEVRHMDKKTERQMHNLHVITADQDLGEAIGHILTIESLKIK
jgi:hypothetical protein